MTIWKRKKLSFGFVSTRFAGTDGVSLETQKWVDVLKAKGCDVYYMAGELDTEPEISHLVPKAYFQHKEILEVQRPLFSEKRRSRAITRKIHSLKEELRDAIQRFFEKFHFDILVVQNALAIPVNIPFGLALTEFIIESGIPTIAHHHDFYWERQRFHSFAAMDYLKAAFPPDQPNIQHVVINSLAGQELARRTGASWTLVPNIMDFKILPQEIDDYNRDMRSEIGLDEESYIILQPTRLVSRKGIETSIELVSRLQLPKCALVIPHEAGDEGFTYRQRIEDYAKFMGVDLRLIPDRIAKERRVGPDGRKRYTLWDVYPHADLISYPSIYEGYGNAFVEAIYFRKPILVNRYQIFEADIEPKGFKVISFDGFITSETVQQVKQILNNPDQLAQMAETNYMLGWRYLSFEMLEEKLEALLANFYGS
ncbi:MAG: glycosyltransferase family 4 protein [Deltaproteobacteria bacterium]|jgi:glycosyltransferase involved in cell wall biosynthesis|nr:glycosyltransferase family 4 protein [Deltaproteobacteria bacterium]